MSLQATKRSSVLFSDFSFIGLRIRPKIDEFHEKEQFSKEKQPEEAKTVDPGMKN